MKDLDQKIPSFPNCDNYRIHRASNPNPLNDNTRTNDNELHQQLCGTFKIDYLQEMDIITEVKVRLERKNNITLPALLPNKLPSYSRGPVIYSDETGQDKLRSRSTRVIPLLAIAQGTAAIGSMLIKDPSDSKAEGAMATTPVADDAPAVSATPESLTSPPGEEQTRSMEVDDGDDSQTPASPVSHREDELLTGGGAIGVEGEMANLMVSSPGGSDGSDGGATI